MDEQELNDYQSKYLDLYEKTKRDREKEKTSILDDIDFELELIHRDDINVGYILTLLENMQGSGTEREGKRFKPTSKKSWKPKFSCAVRKN